MTHTHYSRISCPDPFWSLSCCNCSGLEKVFLLWCACDYPTRRLSSVERSGFDCSWPVEMTDIMWTRITARLRSRILNRTDAARIVIWWLREDDTLSFWFGTRIKLSKWAAKSDGRTKVWVLKARSWVWIQFINIFNEGRSISYEMMLGWSSVCELRWAAHDAPSESDSSSSHEVSSLLHKHHGRSLCYYTLWST